MISCLHNLNGYFYVCFFVGGSVVPVISQYERSMKISRKLLLLLPILLYNGLSTNPFYAFLFV